MTDEEVAAWPPSIAVRPLIPPRPAPGKGRGVYRIIFDIREDEQHVRVLRVWHGFRNAITAADVED